MIVADVQSMRSVFILQEGSGCAQDTWIQPGSLPEQSVLLPTAAMAQDHLPMCSKS